uniref:Uncharacterized protein n=1 Tax=Zea mays TaxID=4577 RepID=B4FKQ1_MAIZE|nr:unknown [Zea mays]
MLRDWFSAQMQAAPSLCRFVLVH